MNFICKESPLLGTNLDMIIESQVIGTDGVSLTTQTL